MNDVWSTKMYYCFSLIISMELSTDSGGHLVDSKKLFELYNQVCLELSSFEKKLVINRARRFLDEYEANIIAKTSDELGCCCNEDEWDRQKINFDISIYENWMKAVSEKKTVQMIYESLSSG